MTLTHIAILALYLYTVYCTFFVLDIPFMRERYREFDVGQFKYLTTWNVVRITFAIPVYYIIE